MDQIERIELSYFSEKDRKFKVTLNDGRIIGGIWGPANRKFDEFIGHLGYSLAAIAESQKESHWMLVVKRNIDSNIGVLK